MHRTPYGTEPDVAKLSHFSRSRQLGHHVCLWTESSEFSCIAVLRCGRGQVTLAELLERDRTEELLDAGQGEVATAELAEKKRLRLLARVGVLLAPVRATTVLRASVAHAKVFVGDEVESHVLRSQVQHAARQVQRQIEVIPRTQDGTAAAAPHTGGRQVDMLRRCCSCCSRGCCWWWRVGLEADRPADLIQSVYVELPEEMTGRVETSTL